MLIKIPGLRLSNTANGSQGRTRRGAHGRSAKRAAIKATAHEFVRNAWILSGRPQLLPAIVTVVRIAPRKLDAWDGLPGSAKQIIDAVSDVLGIRDDDARVTWRVVQRSGAVREYGCEVLIEPRADGLLPAAAGCSIGVCHVDRMACIAVTDPSGEAWAWLEAQQLRAFAVQVAEALKVLES